MTEFCKARRVSTPHPSQLLLVTSSPYGRDAGPLLVARRLAEGLAVSHPGRTLVVRDLDRPSRGAAGLGSSEPWANSAAAIARAGACLGELFDADIMVLAAGVTSRSVSASLKVWFERVMVPGLTFAHRNGRIEGLLHGKKVYLVFGPSGEGADPASQEDDFHEEYLGLMLKIMGLTDVEVIRIDDAEPSAAVWDKVAVVIEKGF